MTKLLYRGNDISKYLLTSALNRQHTINNSLFDNLVFGNLHIYHFSLFKRVNRA